MPTKKPEQKTNTRIITIALAVVIILSIVVVAYTTFTQPTSEDDNTSDDQQNNSSHTKEAPTVLTLSNHDTIIEYTQADINNLETTTGFGGYRTSFPTIQGVGNYTGVAITNLLKPLIQDLTNFSIAVIADDGYISNYSYSEIMGNVSLYNITNASNEEPVSTGGVTMLLAYQFEGQSLDIEKEGRFKIAYVNTTDAITSSRYWTKFVVEIQINPE
jgi:hypothetical protein